MITLSIGTMASFAHYESAVLEAHWNSQTNLRHRNEHINYRVHGPDLIRDSYVAEVRADMFNDLNDGGKNTEYIAAYERHYYIKHSTVLDMSMLYYPTIAGKGEYQAKGISKGELFEIRTETRTSGTFTIGLRIMSMSTAAGWNTIPSCWRRDPYTIQECHEGGVRAISPPQTLSDNPFQNFIILNCRDTFFKHHLITSTFFIVLMARKAYREFIDCFESFHASFMRNGVFNRIAHR